MALVGYLLSHMTPNVTPSTVPHISVVRAAETLRTTPAEVDALVQDGSLDALEIDGRLCVSLLSVNALWAEHARAELREMGVR